MRPKITNLERKSVHYSNARNEILNDQDFLDDLRELAASKGITFDDAKRLCDSYLKEIATSYPKFGLFWKLMEFLVRYLILNHFNRIYVDQKGLRRIKGLSKEYIVQIIPSHKSVFDFMVLPYFIVKETTLMPIILAGEVFSKFPMGILLRKMVAYFVRRNESNKIYYLVFKHYLMLIIKHEMLHMFFIEGGRNKQGTFSEPKSGILKYIIEARDKHRIRKDIVFVPVCISYDFVPESDIVVQEKASGKRKHIASSMLRYFSRRKFGNCYIKVGSPIKLSSMEMRTKEPVGKLGNKIMKEIKRLLTVPSNTILCHGMMKFCAINRNKFRFEELQREFLSCYYELKKLKADISHINPNRINEYLCSAVEKGLVKFGKDEGMIYIVKEAIPIIEYYSNNIVHLIK